MGNYNPSAPIVLGEEWVGIRDETITFAPGIPNYEVGFTFTLEQSRTLQEVRFYLEDWPSYDGQTVMVNIYNADTEDDSGPVKSVIIPCNNGTVTAGTGGAVAFVNATGFADAVASPSDNKYISGDMGRDSATPSKHQAYFAVNSFSQTLTGKRILGVNLLYSLGNTGYSLPFEERPGWELYLAGDSLSRIAYGSADAGGIFGNLVQHRDEGRSTSYSRAELGNYNHFWSSTTPPTTTSERLPWTFDSLARMEISATNRYSVYLTGSDDGTTVVGASIEYLALEVFYCEERRVAFGGREYGVSLPATLRTPWVSNANIVPMRTTALAASPVLPAGRYLLTVSLGSKGFYTPQASPDLVALRELDAISSFEGVQVTVPYPWNDNTIDQELTSEQVHVIPQLSVHTSSGTLTEPHVYGRLAKAPVYGTVTATQEILDAPAGGATSFPQVRFYGRRFGDTTVDLTLDSPSIPGSSVTLTPTEFDSLDELVDGWKEITLRFATAPSMGTGTNPQWRFSASGEAAGNQWQVLGLSAPALSGTPGNLNTSVPAPHTLGSATYGAPSAGTTINLGWLSPLVSATTDDQTSDAVLIFSTDPPTPANVAVEVSQQELSTVDPTCFASGCVPTSLYYNEITWDAITSPTAITGFGSYELQRYDPVDGDFFTIMEATDYTLTTFNDYEARVGQPSVYRLRSTNLYDFAGLWSPQVTATVTSPGVVGADTTILMFTTNSHQDGSGNLAYSAAWMNTPVEEYVWPESGTVVLQDMFNKDYPTAFRPLERGGERFARQILVNAAGIPPATTARGFESLRDMAWDTVPYVCVRNEDGDRWYSTVVVPSGSVRRMITMGRLCMANVQVVEVTDTPYPVDPS